MLQCIGIKSTGDHSSSHSEEELRLMLSSTHISRGRSALGRQIILNAMDLRHRLVREVMRPRNEIVHLDLDKSLEENLKLAYEEEYSRYPLCNESELEQTVGLIHFRDLCRLDPKHNTVEDLPKLKKELAYVPETARLEKLLEHFLKKKHHFALVVDEYGSIVGMVTLENILEELVGQIQDEFDQEEPLIKKIDDHSWELDGLTPLHELSEIIGRPLQEEGISTMSGWLTVKLGEFPKVGDQIETDGFKIEVIQLDGYKVAKLILRKRPTKTSEQAPDPFV